MRVTGLDRIVVMVRDMDKALAFFSGKLGMQFKELDPDISRRDGVRSYICHTSHLHLISPILPLPENAAPPMKKRVELLEKNEAIFNALTFRVDSVPEVEAELRQQGIGIQHRYLESHDYASEGMDDFAEVVTTEKDTLGMVMGFASYRQETPAGAGGEGRVRVTDLDRLVIMVKDVDKALGLFSGKLGMKFRELDPEISLRDGNRGFVCHETHLHMIWPRIPLPATAPLPMRQGAETLGDKESMILVMLFKVDDPRGAVAWLKQQGIGVLRAWEDVHDYVSVGMDNLVEYLLDPKDTLGLPICISNYDRV